MFITHKLRKILDDRLEKTPEGWIWHGDRIDGVAVVRYKGELLYVSQLMAQMGIDFKDMNKYEEQHEDLEGLQSGGDSPDTGDGDSESE